jgi:pimeloyl-ACP methyl ester carboxylesterase
MRLRVNGVGLFVDVLGPGWVPEGPRLRQRPTLLLVHGGPGADHSIYRPRMDVLADVAQLVFYDQRGNGRSDDGLQSAWTLDQWADDLRSLIDTLGIERPFIYGASFGGMVALNLAVRHPGLAAGLVLVATAARGGAFTAERVALFEKLGGPEAGALARRRLIDGDTSPEVLRQWLRVCVPCYGRAPIEANWFSRQVSRPAVTHWFSRPEGEGNHFDLRAALPALDLPVLLMAGSDDPMVPVPYQREMAALLPAKRLKYVEFSGARHLLAADEAQAHDQLVRRFITEESKA